MTVHCLGNGNVCIYGRGVNIFDGTGPEYSSPKAFSMDASFPGAAENDDIETRKLSHIAFMHEVSRGGVSEADSRQLAARIIDLTPEGRNIFVRQIEGNTELTVRACGRGFSRTQFGDTFLVETLPGALIYTYMFENGRPVGYPSAKYRYMALKIVGNCEFSFSHSNSHEDTGDQAELPDIAAVKVKDFGQLIFSFAFDPAEAIDLVAGSPKDRGSGFRPGQPISASDSFLHPKRELSVSPSHPYYREICDGYDIIVSQQSSRGGAIAGYNYRLIYVRDNYGVLRFLIKAGALRRAGMLVNYYIDIFAEYGRVQNAQGAGEYAFHVHENDKAEITGYLIMMLTEYYEASGDVGTLKRGIPLVEYCLRAQHSILSKGMIQFNGDETYIAGELLPRSAINDGSLEATALYHESVRRVLSVPELRGELDAELAETVRRDMDVIAAGFADNFTGPEGQLYCNAPDSGYAPAVRPGGVLTCGHGLGVGFRNAAGQYVCRRCFSKEKTGGICGAVLEAGRNGGAKTDAASGKRYFTEAALLSPAFTGASSLIPEKAITEAAQKTLAELPQREKIVGYEPGFIMYALGYDKKLADRMLSMRDEFGAFSEYYLSGAQSGTLCRPWETAINLAAIIEKNRNRENREK